MPSVTRHLDCRRDGRADPSQILTREWLVTNGLGGYSSGTVAGVATRRYHGALIAALPAPLGRVMMLSHVTERVRLPDGATIDLWGEERTGDRLNVYGAEFLTEFMHEYGLPTWRYQCGDCVLEKRMLMPHGQNTVYVNYRLAEGKGPVRLKLMPMSQFRGHDDSVGTPLPEPFRLSVVGEHYELAPNSEMPPLRMRMYGEDTAFTFDRHEVREVIYRIERSRGYDHEGPLWSPGYFRATLADGSQATLVASAEEWQTIEALSPEEAFAAERKRRQRLLAMAPEAARGGVPAELVLAADQFLIEPAGRAADAAWAHASGDEVRSVIAGYHWFTDWGRDTMISLEGLTLSTGRPQEAGYILRTFAHYVRDGLIPNMFPEGGQEGLYHTADATPWFFQALHRYLAVTEDRETLRIVLPRLIEIFDAHIAGTRFNIHVDPRDGLLHQGAEGYQLTWMDAKVDGWVVTPRRGKAVEINALWYNACRLLADWLAEEDRNAKSKEVAAAADRCYESFNRRFWYADGKQLYDVVDGEQGDDPSCRPNQVLAISLAHPVLDREYWKPVLHTVQEQLLTPMGLRSLAPGHADYKPNYHGDLWTRDAAYHQGTVWAWLIGPFVDAWLRVHPDDKATARAFLEGFGDHLSEACIGQISEIFDADAPYTPRGCIAQAWSIAEVLRCWLKTAE
jgi:predicted glycogen debranching enzyme